MATQREIERRRERQEDLDNDWWVWGVIFTMLALSMMGLATLFSVSIG